MKTYWCVRTRFFDDGRVKSEITKIEADEQPVDTFKVTEAYDEYKDYFDTYKVAVAFCKDAERA